MYITRASVLEIYNEAIRDLLSELALKTDIADLHDSYKISCTESEFKSIDEFKSVVDAFLLSPVDCNSRFGSS